MVTSDGKLVPSASREQGAARACSHGAVALALFGACVACAGLASTTSRSAKPLPAVIVLAAPFSPESTANLTKFAMGAIDGTPTLPRVRPNMIIISTHYMRNRNGGGHTEVAVMAAIDRAKPDTLGPRTLVELSAWTLDVAQPITAAQRRAGVPVTAVTTNAPAWRHPRAVTPADTADWMSLEYVAEALQRFGALRLP